MSDASMLLQYLCDGRLDGATCERLAGLYERWASGGGRAVGKEESGFSAWLSGFARKGRFHLALADVWTALFLKGHRLRIQLGAALAILECDPRGIAILRSAERENQLLGLLSMARVGGDFMVTLGLALIWIPLAYLFR